MKKLLFIFILVSLFFSSLLFSKEKFQLKKIASNLGVVWGMTFISDNKILATSKEGNFYIINRNTKKIKLIKHNLLIEVKGQGGLLDIQSSPNFSKDKKVFFTYVKNQDGQGVTILASAILKNDIFWELKDLLVTKSATGSSVHFGSRITFDEDGHLFFTIGDRGDRPSSQNLKNHAGTVIRLNLDGTIPKDNPFLNNENALDEIYSYGHRNPQGVFFDKSTNRLWLIEHGPRGGDEINLVKKGLNYGWPIISYGKEYWSSMSVGEGTHKKGMEQPKKVYVPSIAPSSLIVYSGKVFKSWEGKLLAGALKLRHLNIITLDENLNAIKEERILKNLKERIRNIIEGPKGFLYISTDNGNIYEISPKN